MQPRDAPPLAHASAPADEPPTPFAEALRTVLSRTPVGGRTEHVPLPEAVGRILAADAVAGEPVPVCDNSAVDGYAVRSQDVATLEHCRRRPLSVIGVRAANQAGTETVGPGEALQIMTGAPVPAGADAIVMREDTWRDAERVWILRPAEAGKHVRPAGGDLQPGAVVLNRGTRLNAARVGLLAAIGQVAVSVARRPRVAILATGDEVIPPGEALVPGKVRDANSYTLDALVRAAGALAFPLGIVPDRRDALREALQRALAAHDVVITSGGVSLGDFDYVEGLVAELGVTVHIRSIAMRPGKPLVFGTQDATLFFGLPGNPVSSMVTFLQLVRPALLRWMGMQDAALPSLQAVLAAPFDKQDDRLHFARGVLESTGAGAPRVRLTGHQGSERLHSMAHANCLVLVPETVRHLDAGAPVTVQLLGESWLG